MRGSKGFEIGRPATVGVYLCAMAALLFVVCGCGEQLTRMEENQIKLQAMMAANAREIATLSSQIHNGTGKLTEGIQNLDAQGRAIATGVQTVRDDQGRLHETVVAGNQSLDTKVTGLQESQQSLHDRVTQVQDVTGRTASDLTALAQQHTALHETVQANQRELNKHVDVVVSNQQGIQAGVASVTGKQDALSAMMQDNDRQTAERLASLAAGHEKLSTDLLNVNALVQTGNQSLSDKLVILELNQQNHQASVDRVAFTADQTAATIAAMAAAQTAMQESLIANHEQVAGRLTSLAGSQQNLQTGIDALNGKADRAATDSATAVSSLQETLRISRDVVTGQMASSLQNQQAIQIAVQELNGKTDGLAAGVAAVSAEQTAARETSKINHETIITAMAGLSDGHQTLRTGIDQVNSKTDTTAAELSAAAQRQNAMQQGLASVNESLVSHAAAVAENQQTLNAGIGDLSTRTQQLSGDLASVATAQNSFRQMQQNHNEAIDIRTAELADNQRSLRNQMDTLTATAGQTALSVLTLNNGQATFQQAMQAGMNGLNERAGQIAEQQTALHQSVKTGNESLAARTAAIGEDQQTLKTDVVRTARVIDRAYADLTAVAIAQETLQTTFAGRSDEISSRVARIEGNQKVLGENLDVLTATTGQTALDLLELTDSHADLHQSVKTGNEAVIAQTTALGQGQKTLGGQLDVLTETSGQTALDILALGNDQSTLAKTVQSGLADLSRQTGLVANNQQQMQNGMEVLTATAGQTALDVLSVAGRQDTLHRTIQSHSESTDTRMAKLADNQQQMRNGIEVLTATAGQTALDVIGVSGRQDGLQQAIRSHGESADTCMTKLAENQQKIQSSLDTVTATTGQTTRDIVALSDVQARSEQAAQTSRVELADKLTAMAQDQQSWLQRFDAAQARIQAMADGIATLDQQLAKLQGSLQEGLQNTTTLLDANGRQRQQFEVKVAQDVQAMIDAITQLRQTQALLQEQMSQVQKNTQSQADTLKATIEQIKQPPVEAKVSDAKKVEPAVVETGE